MKLLTHLTTTAFIFTATNSFAHSLNDWTLETEGPSFEVYSKESQDKRYEILARADVQTSLGAFLALMQDAERAPDWVANCKKIMVQTSSSGLDAIVHSYYDAPWPVKDRDMVTKTHIHLDDDQQGYTVSVSDLGQDIPKSVGYIRIQNVEGAWDVRQLEGGFVRVTYQGSGNPAGNLPQWVTNDLLVQSTSETFEQMTQLLREDQYRNASTLALLHHP